MVLSKITNQIKFWASDDGRAYTDRNAQSIDELNQCYLKDYGITRRAMNEEFLNNLDKSLKILEIGANIGLQLKMLRKIGFQDLKGIEINNYAVGRAKKIHPEVDIIKGSVFDLPFRDGYFDLVFTSGVLIHINPKDLGEALAEIWRATNRYIWGFEYYAPQLTEVNYRGKDGLLWKTDFTKLYLDKFPSLKLIKEKKFKLADSENISQMFLLEK